VPRVAGKNLVHTEFLAVLIPTISIGEGQQAENASVGVCPSTVARNLGALLPLLHKSKLSTRNSGLILG
jgi:hypothetical protein